MSHDDMIAVIQAHKEGKTVECSIPPGDHYWRDCNGQFDFVTYIFRVKPEPPKPREFWLTKCKQVKNGICVSDKEPRTFGCCEEVIHVREVLE